MVNNEPTGFTLVELLIAMAVAAILLSVAAPSFNAVIQNQRLQGALGPVSLAAFTARSEATKSGDTLTMCARASDTQCGTDWNNGLLVFRDSAIVRGESQAVIDPFDEVIRIEAPHGYNVQLRAMASSDRTASTAYAPNFVRYEPDGSSNWQNGSFYVCDGRGAAHALALHITITGDIRSARRPDDISGAIVKDVFGRDISCD